MIAIKIVKMSLILHSIGYWKTDSFIEWVLYPSLNCKAYYAFALNGINIE